MFKRIRVSLLCRIFRYLYHKYGDSYMSQYDHYRWKLEQLSKKMVLYNDFLQYIQNRANLPLADYEKLSAPLPFDVISNEFFGWNDYYGIAQTYKEYAGYPNSYKLRFSIDHAVFFWQDFFNAAEYNNGSQIHMVTSEYAKRCISKNTSYELYPAGLHIFYAKDYYTKEVFDKEKDRLGKNLLVFPCHSSDCLLVDFNPKKLINEILMIKQDGKFDSVTICFYFSEIQRGFHKKFDGYGFNFVTAGHIIDPMFISRLKTIIKLSDVTMSNAIGSHIFYSLGMDKPHYLANETNMQFYSTYSLNQNSEISKKEIADQCYSLQDSILQQYERIFSKYTEILTEEQLKLRDKICGKDSLKTSNEIKEFFEYTERLWKQNKQKPNTEYVHSFTMHKFIKDFNFDLTKN